MRLTILNILIHTAYDIDFFKKSKYEFKHDFQTDLLIDSQDINSIINQLHDLYPHIPIEIFNEYLEIIKGMLLDSATIKLKHKTKKTLKCIPGETFNKLAIEIRDLFRKYRAAT